MKNYISINNHQIGLTEEQVEAIRKILNLPEIKLADKPAGDIVKIGEHEMIVLEHIDGKTLLLKKDPLRESQEFGESNQYVGSYVDCICQEFGAEIAALVGDENIFQHEVDLTANDGLKDYGTVERYASLLTANQARQYVEILDKYKLNAWWWLATPWSTPTHGSETGVLCVSPSGGICNDVYYNVRAVRPFCILNSNIFVSQ